jgi:ABC-2 type transport system ATP-binding protein
MITIENLTKQFDTITAIDRLSLRIPDSTIFGLLGTNGAGKSTLLKLLAGILAPEQGKILIDGEPVYENPSCKEQCFYLSDEPYYFPNATAEDMTLFYRKQYPSLEPEAVRYLAGQLELDTTRPLRTFSKGMKRQIFLIMALCSNTAYLFCDEIFDGLDPIVTDAMKHLFQSEMQTRPFTIIVAAHKLQDLEGFCGEIGILHKGGILCAQDMRQASAGFHKFQCIFEAENKEGLSAYLSEHLDIVSYSEDGYFLSLILQGSTEHILPLLQARSPVFCREVPMSVEELFMAKIKEAGYDIRKALY